MQKTIEEQLIDHLRKNVGLTDSRKLHSPESLDLDQALEQALADTLELAIFLQKMITIRQEAKLKVDAYTQQLEQREPI